MKKILFSLTFLFAVTIHAGHHAKGDDAKSVVKKLMKHLRMVTLKHGLHYMQMILRLLFLVTFQPLVNI